jgi:DUF1009 family protein
VAKFDPSLLRVAIIAGNGILPGEIYREMQKNKQNPLLIGISGEVSDDLRNIAAEVLSYGQLSKLFELLSKQDIKHAIFAGGITKRPDFTKLKLDLNTLKEVPTLVKIMMGGDNSILAKISDFFAKKGITIVGAHQVVPSLLAPHGIICGKPAKKLIMPVVEKAFKAAKAIGAIDVGQAAIAEDSRVIALEAAEGTDAMIHRVAQLRDSGRLSLTPKIGVLAKAMKPKQDMRADLPAIGPDTIDSVVGAGLSGIAIEAGRSLILDRVETIKRANTKKIFIIGVTLEDFPS